MSVFLESWRQFMHVGVGQIIGNKSELNIVTIIEHEKNITVAQHCFLRLIHRFREKVTFLINNNHSISVTVVNGEGREVQAQVIDLKMEETDKIFTTASVYILRAFKEDNILFANPSWFLPALTVLPVDQSNVKNNLLTFLGSVVWYNEQRQILEENLLLIRLSIFLAIGELRVHKWTGFEIMQSDKIPFILLTNWLYVRTIFKLFLFRQYFESISPPIPELKNVLDIWEQRTQIDTPILLQQLEGVEKFKNFRFASWNIENYWFDYKTSYTQGGTLTAATTYNVHVRAPLSFQKCAVQRCGVFISLGLPYCRAHLRTVLHLRLSRNMKQGLTWNRDQLERVNEYADGVFTDRAIASGATIFEYSGPILQEIQIKNRYQVLEANKWMPYVCKVGTNQWIDGTLDRHVVFMIKRHLVPNVELVVEDNKVKCKALRVITLTEELKVSCVYSQSATTTDTTWQTEVVEGNLQQADIAKRNNPTQVTTSVAESAAFRLLRRGIAATLGATAATAATGKAVLDSLRKQWRRQTLNQTDADRLQLHKNIVNALTLVTDINEVPEDDCSVCLNPLFQLENGTRKWIVNSGEEELAVIGPPPAYNLLEVPAGDPLTVSKTNEGKPTSHYFHTSCIITALGASGKCPVCRHEFFTLAINV